MDESPKFPPRHGHRDTRLGSEQVIDNTSSRTIAAHQRVGFAEKWLAARFAETQWGEHGDRGTGLADPHDRHRSDAGCRAGSGLPTEVSLNGHFNVESVVVLSAAHRVTPFHLLRRPPYVIRFRNADVPEESSTMPRVGTLA
jgi:hypothetical protein